MQRCVDAAPRMRRGAAVRKLLCCTALCLSAGAALAQVQRNFPQNALRGQVEFGAPPELLLNGQPARLSPGSRIRDPSQMLVMSGALAGQKLIVNYTQDGMGQLHEVWILSAAEIARKPWPSTAREAQEWRFDPTGQYWVKP